MAATAGTLASAMVAKMGDIVDDPLICVCGRRLTKMGEGKAVSTKNLIVTNLMVAGDSRVGKVMVCLKIMVCDL